MAATLITASTSFGGAPGLSTGFATPSASNPPGVTYDGDHTQVFCCGAPLVTYPFQNESGDITTRLVRQPVRGDKRA